MRASCEAAGQLAGPVKEMGQAERQWVQSFHEQYSICSRSLAFPSTLTSNIFDNFYCSFVSIPILPAILLNTVHQRSLLPKKYGHSYHLKNIGKNLSEPFWHMLCGLH